MPLNTLKSDDDNNNYYYYYNNRLTIKDMPPKSAFSNNESKKEIDKI